MLKHSKEGIPYTTDKMFAEKFKVEDNTPIHFIKNESYKKYLQIHGSWKKFYKKIGSYFVLPPSEGSNKRKEHAGIYLDDNLFDRQKELIKEMVSIYDSGKKSCFVVSGTGTGKGHIIPSLLKSFEGLKILILAPNNVVGDRLMDDINDVAVYARGKKIKEVDNDIVLTLYKTFNLYFDYLNGKFDMVIIDEGHHLGGQMEDNLYTWKSFICGMSATPYRNEYNEEGFKMFFGNIIDTEKQALPVKVFEHKFKYEYSSEDVIKASEGLPTTSPEIYRRLIIENKKRFEELVLMIDNIETKGFKNYIIFSDRLEHIDRLENLLKKEFTNKHVQVIKGKTDVLNVMKELKNKQDIIIIGSTSVVKEGMNIPQLEIGILFTSASFKGGLDQMAGRVRRFYGDKQYGYFIDFQDYISINGSKYKSPGVYSRRKAYKSFKWPIGNFINDFINKY